MNIAIEGNIGSNKKGLIEFIKENFENIEVTPAFGDDAPQRVALPLKESYAPPPGSPFRFEKFVADPNKWAFEMGVDFLLHAGSTYAAGPQIVNVFNRTHLTFDAYVEACVGMDYISAESGTILKRLKNTLQFPTYDHVIYVRSNPNDCYENAIERGNTGIDYMYIQKLHEEYEKLFGNPQPAKPLISIDSGRIDNLNRNELSREYLTEFIVNKLGLSPKIVVDDYDEWTLVKRKKHRKTLGGR